MSYEIGYYSEALQQNILALPDDIVADYLRLADLLREFGPDVRMPHSRALSGGLFELRPKGLKGTGRVFYCFLQGKRVIVLHCFVKKTRETPRREIATARKRMQEVKNAHPR